MDREEIMLAEAAENIPADVRSELERYGFVPTLDAGNLWFYDKGNIRLCFGMDGFDYPQSLDAECYAVEFIPAEHQFADEPFVEGTLRDVLDRIGI